MKVRERFKLDEGDLYLLVRDRDPRWVNVARFYARVKDKPVETLSDWQNEWMRTAAEQIADAAARIRRDIG